MKKIGYNINMLNIIASPYSYNSNAEKIVKRIVSFLKSEKVDYSVFFSPDLNSLETNVKQLVVDGETEFVVVGDDPILNLFINSIKDLSKIKLGIVPIGGEDDFAECLGVSFNPIQAIKDILEKNVETVDYLVVNDSKAINNILIGASAEIYEIYNQYKIKNSITRAYVTRQNAAKFEGIELTFYSRNKQPQTEIIFELSISNGGLKKGKNVSPLANVKDGLFNFNYASVSEKNDKKKYLAMFNKGNQIYDEKTKQFWINNLKIFSPNKKIKAIVDGKLNTYEELNISIVENGLKIYKK